MACILLRTSGKGWKDYDFSDSIHSVQQEQHTGCGKPAEKPAGASCDWGLPKPDARPGWPAGCETPKAPIAGVLPKSDGAEAG